MLSAFFRRHKHQNNKQNTSSHFLRWLEKKLPLLSILHTKYDQYHGHGYTNSQNTANQTLANSRRDEALSTNFPLLFIFLFFFLFSLSLFHKKANFIQFSCYFLSNKSFCGYILKYTVKEWHANKKITASTLKS